jgi:hypothetical protein
MLGKKLVRLRTKYGKKRLTLIVLPIALLLLAGGGVYAALGGVSRPTSSSDISLQKGLVGWWKLDGNPKDSTPYGNTGAVTGATLTTDRKGKSNSAYNIFGNQYVATTNTSALDPTAAMSLSLWMMPTGIASATAETLISTKEAGGYVLLATGTSAVNNCPASTVCFGLFINSTSSMTTVSVTKSAFTDNNWYQIAATYDGASMKLYVNGSVVATTSITGSITDGVAPNMCIGSEVTAIDCNGGSNWRGNIDDVRIYNRALSAPEATALNDQYDPGLKAASGENSLAGWWKLDGNAKDSSPYRDNGIMANSPVAAADREGAANAAVMFNGTTSHITAPDAARLKYTGGNMTISVWMKPNTTEVDGGYIVSKPWNGSGGYNYRLQYTSSRQIVGFISGATAFSFTAPAVLTANTWNHIVMTMDSTSHVKLYINGQQNYSNAHTIVSWTATDLNVKLAIGNLYPYGQGWGGNSVYNFDGTVDDVRIYTRVLSPAEISALYGSYNSQVTVSNLQSGLVGDWPLNGNAKDSTPYRNHGTATAATLTTDRKGKANSAYSFDGTTSSILASATGLPSVTRTGTYTISAWILPGTNPSMEPVVQSSLSCSDRNSLAVNGTLASVGYYNGTSWTGKSGTIPGGVWTHLVGVNQAGTLALYINGAAQAGTSAPYSSCTGTLFGRSDSSGRFYNGNIDDVRIWNRALSSSEVNALYASYR